MRLPLFLLAALAASASAAESPRGLFLVLEPHYVIYSGISPRYVSRFTPGTLFFTEGLAQVDAKPALAPRVTAGWSFGPKGSLSLSWLRTDSEGAGRFDGPGQAIDSTPIEIYDELVLTGGQPAPDSAEAKNRVRVTQVDLLYERGFEVFERLSLVPGAGLRYLSLSNDVAAAYTHRNPGFSYARQRLSWSRGIGPWARFAGDLRFFGNLTGRLGFDFGVLFGKDSTAQTVCKGASFNEPGCGSAITFSSERSRTFRFFGGESSMNYVFGKSGVDLSAGYRTTTYFDLVTKEHAQPGQRPTGAGAAPERATVTMGSLFMSLRCFF